jgi:hypothetical protein
LSYLKSIDDDSLTSLGMRFCINYLKLEEMSEFFDLLNKKMKSWAVLVANPWISWWRLQWADGVKFFYNDNKQPIKKDEKIELKSWDRYTIVFLDDDGKSQNKWTQKTWYSESYFKEFEKDNNGKEMFKIERKKIDENLPLVMIVKKI